MKDYKDAELGQLGGRAITGTSSVTANANGYFYKIQFVTSAIVTAQTNFTGADNPILYAITAGFTAGSVAYGKYTGITLSQGSAIGYFGN